MEPELDDYKCGIYMLVRASCWNEKERERERSFGGIGKGCGIGLKSEKGTGERV